MSAFVVTAGPTIGAQRISALAPHARVVPPIAFGDAFGYGLREGDALLVIDGLFAQRPSVRHRELLGLLDDGVRVAGASSMGALRAAELDVYGMTGYGRVYAGYRDGILEADDEVAVVHGCAEDGWPVFVDALVNMRATLERAEHEGVLSGEQHAVVLAAARTRSFTARAWPEVFEAARCSGIPPMGSPSGRELVRALRRLRVDLKRADAELAIASLAADVGGFEPAFKATEPIRTRPGENMFSSRWRLRQNPPRPVGESDGPAARPLVTDAVRDLDVFSMLRLSARDSWFLVPALEQLAAWHADLIHAPALSTSVLDRARAACLQVGCSLETSRIGASGAPRALELVALAHLCARGVCGPDGPPASIVGHWCVPDEFDGLDAPARAAVLAGRVHLRTPAEPAHRHPIAAILADPRFSAWQRLAAAARAVHTAAAAAHPELDLDRPKPRKLAELFAKRWGSFTTAELARRGFSGLSDFTNATAPFAVAAAQGTLETLTVGPLAGFGGVRGATSGDGMSET